MKPEVGENPTVTDLHIVGFCEHLELSYGRSPIPTFSATCAVSISPIAYGEIRSGINKAPTIVYAPIAVSELPK